MSEGKAPTRPSPEAMEEAAEQTRLLFTDELGNLAEELILTGGAHRRLSRSQVRERLAAALTAFARAGVEEEREAAERDVKQAVIEAMSRRPGPVSQEALAGIEAISARRGRG